MSSLNLWAVMLGGMVVTYLTRLSFVVFVPQERLPALFRRGLKYVPPAVLSAILLPAILRPDGPLDLSPGNYRLIAAVLAGLVGWRWRNVWLTIVTGMAVLLGLTALQW